MILFIGERRSERAISMGVTWADGHLAAKTLFDALRECGIDPLECQFVNWFEPGGSKIVQNHPGIRVAMGRKVQRELERRGLVHIPLIHPAARGTIRLKDNYIAHVKTALEGAMAYGNV